MKVMDITKTYCSVSCCAYSPKYRVSVLKVVKFLCRYSSW